jgi:hypothetical protein
LDDWHFSDGEEEDGPGCPGDEAPPPLPDPLVPPVPAPLPDPSEPLGGDAPPGDDPPPGGGGGGGHGADANPWRTWNMPPWGKLVLNEKGPTPSLAAHCFKHGALCRVNRVMSKRPLGYLVAWLQAQNHVDCISRETHMHRIKTLKALGEPLSLANRIPARALVEAMHPDLRALEPNAEGGLPQEPFNV